MSSNSSLPSLPRHIQHNCFGMLGTKNGERLGYELKRKGTVGNLVGRTVGRTQPATHVVNRGFKVE